jgi:riboflavin synthase
MFSGIIKNQGVVYNIKPVGSNKVFWIRSAIVTEFYIDQSLAHNGVCLTVEEIKGDLYRVTAISETLSKTNLGSLKPGDYVNLEQSITYQTMLDGHIVQGHIDTTGTCIQLNENDGSYVFTFRYPPAFNDLIIEKGSVAVNGVSLTAFDCIDDCFSVAIIPYTYSHTSFSTLKPGENVNIEFDILGKYVKRIMGVRN